MSALAQVKHIDFISRCFYLILALSLVILSVSYGMEIFVKIRPCRICSLQRICYFFIVFLAILGVYLPQKNVVGSILLVVSTLSLLLASYHIGIQAGLFSDFCTTFSPIDLSDFKKMLFQSQSSCSSIHWLFFLPTSAWSLIFSSLFSSTLFFALIGRKSDVILTSRLHREKVLLTKFKRWLG